MALLTYQQTRPWAKAIKTNVLSGKMPPWPADPHFGKFANDRSLTRAELDTLAALGRFRRGRGQSLRRSSAAYLRRQAGTFPSRTW